MYVSDETYSNYMLIAKRRNKKAASLIRDAMDWYFMEKLSRQKSLSEWQPLDLGKVKNDWISGDFREEMLDSRGIL